MGWFKSVTRSIGDAAKLAVNNTTGLVYSAVTNKDLIDSSHFKTSGFKKFNVSSAGARNTIGKGMLVAAAAVGATSLLGGAGGASKTGLFSKGGGLSKLFSNPMLKNGLNSFLVPKQDGSGYEEVDYSQAYAEQPYIQGYTSQGLPIYSNRGQNKDNYLMIGGLALLTLIMLKK